MNSFVLKRNFQFKLPNTTVELIRLKFTKLLNLFEYSTFWDHDILYFQKKQISPNSQSYSALEVLREGSITISPGTDKLTVNWSIKLISLYFISSVTCIATSIIAYILLRPQILTLFITLLLSFGLILAIAYLYILSKIEEVKATCLEDD